MGRFPAVVDVPKGPGPPAEVDSELVVVRKRQYIDLRYSKLQYCSSKIKLAIMLNFL